jgi:uncharacterized protein YegL
MRRLPIYFLLDVSGSMRGEPVAAVNEGLNAIVTALRRDPMALETAWISVLVFDDTARELRPLTELTQFVPPTLTVGTGLTALGAGLSLLADRLAQESERSRSRSGRKDWLPLVFILSDGEPTDDWQVGLNRLRAIPTGTVVACAAGAEANVEVLLEVTPTVVQLTSVSGESLSAFFKWVSASVSVVNQAEESAGSTDPLSRLPKLPPGIERARRAPDSVARISRFNREGRDRAITMDRFGNPAGPQFDLAKDGAFTGARIAVLHLYTGEGFDFKEPEQALAQKGFAVTRWVDIPPPPSELAQALERSSQLWVISDCVPKLTQRHIELIHTFFASGRGVYLWGDNEPYYADANLVAQALFGGALHGNTPGDHVVQRQLQTGKSGFVSSHDMFRGLENVYEGITISSVMPNPVITPALVGSAGNLVVATYNHGRSRAVVDGGFTRLYHKWDTAGTGRYVKNAAAWLANYERFGERLFKQS